MVTPHLLFLLFCLLDSGYDAFASTGSHTSDSAQKSVMICCVQQTWQRRVQLQLHVVPLHQAEYVLMGSLLQCVCQG